MSSELPDNNVFLTYIEDMNDEFLAESTDEFVITMIRSFFGEEMLKKLDESGQARIVAVAVCNRFLEMMQERCVRVAERETTVDWLNSLLDK